MKIAVVTDDGTTISQHFGRARYYEVFTLESGGVTGRERREKPAHQGHHHQHHSENETVSLDEGSGTWEGRTEEQDFHSLMFAPIRDCTAALTRGLGRGGYDSLRAMGIEPIITVVRDIDEAVQQYLQGELVNHPERLH